MYQPDGYRWDKTDYAHGLKLAPTGFFGDLELRAEKEFRVTPRCLVRGPRREVVFHNRNRCSEEVEKFSFFHIT